MNVELWNISAGSNNATPPDGFPEGMQQRDFNDTTREMMAAIRRWFDNPEFQDFNGGATVSRVSASTFRVAGVDKTAYYTAGRIFKVDGSGGPAVGQVQSASFTGGNTDVVGNVTIPVGTNSAKVFFAPTLRGAALINTGTSPGTIPTNSGTGALGSAAYKDAGATAGQVPINSQSAALAAFAYRSGIVDTYTESKGGDQTTGSSAEVAITGLSNITIPATPDGSKKYRVSVYVPLHIPNIGGSVTMRVRIGTAGNITDSAIVLNADFSTPSGALETVWTVPSWVITPAANSKVTISMAGTTGMIARLNTTAGLFSYVDVVEVAN